MTAARPKPATGWGSSSRSRPPETCALCGIGHLPVTILATATGVTMVYPVCDELVIDPQSAFVAQRCGGVEREQLRCLRLTRGDLKLRGSGQRVAGDPHRGEFARADEHAGFQCAHRLVVRRDRAAERVAQPGDVLTEG